MSVSRAMQEHIAEEQLSRITTYVNKCLADMDVSAYVHRMA